MDSWIRNQEEVFGRGLNLGQQREQQRIIKLLEENLESWEECIVFRKTYDTANVSSLIALIKGEK